MIHSPGSEPACPHVPAPQIMAQLLALGNFPSYIKTVIYSWPGGNLGTYPVAQTKGATQRIVIDNTALV